MNDSTRLRWWLSIYYNFHGLHKVISNEHGYSEVGNALSDLVSGADLDAQQCSNPGAQSPRTQLQCTNARE